MNYPEQPKMAPESLGKISPAFRKEAIKVLLSIFFFLFIYVLLIIAAIGLAAVLGYLGYYLVIAFPRLITLLIGLALALVGIMVLFFLVKFIFSSNKVDRSAMVEVKRSEEPELFAFIDRVNAETDSPKPKKIYLSNQVNASVFYDSSFWSMFFPVKKNLNIGLGVVNAVNLTEFKAIMAHEFGHFSQRSMKLGSYIYNVNRVIYNMLFENEGFDRNLNSMEESNGYLALSSVLTSGVVRIIQAILRRVYTIVNKSYMSLSRQMEFHADAISAKVTGSNHMRPALQRLQIAGFCFEHLLNTYNNWGEKGYQSENIYENMRVVMRKFAEDHEFEMKGSLVEANDERFEKLAYSKVKVEDQWASHPTYEQRVQHLKDLNLDTDAVEASVWTLFKDPLHTQKQFTQLIFREIQYPKEVEIKLLSNDEFAQKLAENQKEFSFSPSYNGYYDDYFPVELAIHQLETSSPFPEFDTIFNKDRIKSLKESNYLYQDRKTLEQILLGELKVKSFDYDGQKFKREDAKNILKQVDQEISELESKTQKLDEKAILYFLDKASAKNEKDEYIRRFEAVQRQLKRGNKNVELYAQIMISVSPLFGNISVEEAQRVNTRLKDKELGLKKAVRAYLEYEELRIQISQDDQEFFERYLKSNMNYMSFEIFNEDQFTFLMEVVAKFMEVNEKISFDLKKSFLEYQISLGEAA